MDNTEHSVSVVSRPTEESYSHGSETAREGVEPLFSTMSALIPVPGASGEDERPTGGEEWRQPEGEDGGSRP